MAILSGRFGSVKYDPTGAGGVTAVEIASIKGWKLSLKTDYEDVTCYGDTNKVYIPGMRDVSGTLEGFFNSADLTVIEATSAATPGFLELITNENDLMPTVPPTFSGLAYLDADLDCSLAAPKLTATFKAAAAWTLPTSA